MLIIVIWATGGQQAQHCVSQVRDGHIHTSSGEAEVLFLVKNLYPASPSFLNAAAVA